LTEKPSEISSTDSQVRFNEKKLLAQSILDVFKVGGGGVISSSGCGEIAENNLETCAPPLPPKTSIGTICKPILSSSVVKSHSNSNGNNALENSRKHFMPTKLCPCWKNRILPQMPSPS
jgi:hypothetical protein